MDNPNVVILAGPNGAGKSTMARKIVRDEIGIRHFVNADAIARGLSEFDSETMALKAGRIMLQHLQDLAAARSDFAFETTLASRTFAPWMSELIQTGYRFHLIFLWLPLPEMAILRVRDRVRRGGHSIPEETIRRRYERGIRNFFSLYASESDTYRFYDNSDPKRPRLLAEKNGTIVKVRNVPLWNAIQASVQS